MYLNLLVQLAKVDGFVVEEEVRLIRKIGKAHGLASHDIESCLLYPSYEDDLGGIAKNLKKEFLEGLVRLMNVDGKIFEEEINFSLRMAKKLGLSEDMLKELGKMTATPRKSAVGARQGSSEWLSG